MPFLRVLSTLVTEQRQVLRKQFSVVTLMKTDYLSLKTIVHPSIDGVCILNVFLVMSDEALSITVENSTLYSR